MTHPRLVTDAEVLQEILHRYVAIDRRDAIQPAFDLVLNVVDEVLPVDEAAVERAKDIVLGHRLLSARDALHVAVMEQPGIEKILSFDSGFDGFRGISPPALIRGAWFDLLALARMTSFRSCLTSCRYKKSSGSSKRT